MKSAIFAQARHILELVSTIMVPGTTTKFVAREKFVINIKPNALVKISFIGDNFAGWFLAGDGKIEGPREETKLRYHKLLESSVDGPIIQELGGEERSETTLSEMFFLMKTQKNGEAGVLLNTGYANIFYITDRAGMLRSVFVYWFGDGWCVYASSVLYPFRWFVGRHVFSRNSVLS